MTAYLALIATLIQTAAIAYAYLTPVEWLFADAMVYGSPFYMIMHALGSNSVLHGPALYMGYAAYHIFKYVCIFHAKINASFPRITMTAAILEILYLCASAYYLY